MPSHLNDNLFRSDIKNDYILYYVPLSDNPFGQQETVVCTFGFNGRHETVYIPPDANVARAASEVTDMVMSLRLLSPDAPNFVLRDMNSCDLQPSLPTFQQSVTCKTRENKTLDKCYGNIPNAYKSAQKVLIRTSDHNAVHLIPSYRQKLKTGKIVSKEVCAWSGDVAKQLQGCFECTDWDMFFHLIALI